MVSVVIEEEFPSTFTVSLPAAGFKVTVRSRTRLTATTTSASAWAKPDAFTVRRYVPGGRPSRRNSPLASLTDSRRNEESVACSPIFAEGTRAPLVSCTVPRNDPRGFCACSGNHLAVMRMIANRITFFM